MVVDLMAGKVSVKIDATVYRMAQTVSAWRDVDVADYLSEIVGPVIKKDRVRMPVGELPEPVEEKRDRKTANIKIHYELHRLLKLAAVYRGISMSEYLSEAARPAVERDLARMCKEIASIRQPDPDA